MSAEALERAIKAGVAKLPALARRYLEETHFDARTWSHLGSSIGTTTDATARRAERNVVRGDYAWPHEFAAMGTWSESDRALWKKRGDALLAQGKVATIVMAGGMATRMAGVVKALMPLDGNVNFLDARLAIEHSRIGGKTEMRPLWLMTSLATHTALEHFVNKKDRKETIRLFQQDMGVRFSGAGEVWLDGAGAAGLSAAGHGCLIDAVRRSGLLRDFIAQGGEYVFIVNIDNIAATLDPAILGWLASQPTAPGLVEVCDRLSSDRGGVVLHNNATGFDEIVEEFRLPRGFIGSDSAIFNTNTFLVRADVLQHTKVTEAWLEVEKKVDERSVIQFERLIQELTAAVPMLYLRVPREGVATRFLPIKDTVDLTMKAKEIRALLAASDAREARCP